MRYNRQRREKRAEEALAKKKKKQNMWKSIVCILYIMCCFALVDYAVSFLCLCSCSRTCMKSILFFSRSLHAVWCMFVVLLLVLALLSRALHTLCVVHFTFYAWKVKKGPFLYPGSPQIHVVTDFSVDIMGFINISLVIVIFTTHAKCCQFFSILKYI